MTPEELPSLLYDSFARVGQALAHAHRLRIMNLVCQREFAVDELATAIDQSLANTSAHLKVLREAHLVTARRQGKQIFYRPAGPSVIALWLALRDMGFEQHPEVSALMDQYAQESSALPTLIGTEILQDIKAGNTILLDLRPTEEFAAGHLPGARSLPFSELDSRLDEIPRDRPVIAYCRGPFCTNAITGSNRLRDAGFRVRRLQEGVAEWRARNLNLES